MRVVLASASPARLATLRGAGLDPEVIVSGVDEDAIEAELGAAGTLHPADLVLALATAKADAVASTLDGPAIVIGCDSMLDLDGVALGKPAGPEEATEHWRQLAGRSGVLRTGHSVVDTGNGRRVAAVASTTVHFGTPSSDEVAAYIATGEPLAVAGAFTIDSLGGWFVDSIEGDHGTVIGISLPVLRGLLAEVGVSVVDLWALAATGNGAASPRWP